MVLFAWLVAFAPAQASPIDLPGKTGASHNQFSDSAAESCGFDSGPQVQKLNRRITEDIFRPLTAAQDGPADCILTHGDLQGFFASGYNSGPAEYPDARLWRVVSLKSVVVFGCLFMVAGLGMQQHRQASHFHRPARRRGGRRRRMAWI